ncbi:MAG: class I SAM-dependent RNA methyltransferase [Burkholderiales bacterium]|nr:class I SAM-dependent RNA methyltransferase [Burkholderiales bacterium]
MNPELKPFYAVLPYGLEELFAKELVNLGIDKYRLEKSGCSFGATFNQMMKVNLWSRIASRILLKLAEDAYRTEKDIYEVAFKVKWEDWFTADQSIKISVTSHRSPLKSINFAALRIKDAICDRFRDKFGQRPDVEKHHPDIQIFVHLTEKKVLLYLDTSGEALFKRGWREDKGEAPLKENLAAGLLGLAEWKPEVPLYDPFCGSGTIVIEASCIAAGIAPGINRKFGFEKFKNFDAQAWASIKQEARKKLDFNIDVSLAGSDISTLVVEKAKKNAELAGLKPWLESGKLKFFACDARTCQPTSSLPGMVIANPPYGGQSNPKSASVPSLMKDIADNFKKHFTGWTIWLLTSDRELPRQMRLSESKKIVLFNGPLECRFFKFEMVAGSHRRIKVTQSQSQSQGNEHS